MALQHVIILGAGPAGMSAALTIALEVARAENTSLKISIVELRPSLETIGGAINLTPLGMKYIDYLGAGKHLRPRCINLNHGLDYISLRTGKLLGNFWGNIGNVRVARHVLVESLLRTIQEEYSDIINIQWGKKTTSVTESSDKVIVELEDGAIVEGDILIAADGIHSIARRKWVEPGRDATYHGYVVTMGFVDRSEADKSTPPLLLPDDRPALIDTTLLAGSNGILLASYWEPTRKNVYFTHIENFEIIDGQNSREDWKALANDQNALKQRILASYNETQIKGIPELVSSCKKWHFWPIEILPGKGRWSKGKVLLIGDAAHAMPPQGESTGLAIEDGVLVGRILAQRGSRTIEELFHKFEQVRKPIVDRHYDNAIWSMQHGLRKNGWLTGIIMEWITWCVLLYRRWNQEDHFSGDVRSLDLS